MSKSNANDVATLVVRHLVKREYATQYEVWLRLTVAQAQEYKGHLGVDIIKGESAGLPLYTCVLKFSCVETLQHWLTSQDRKTSIENVEDMLADGDHTEVIEAREFWFTPDNHTAPRVPRWKQACVSLVGILPLTLFVPVFWKPLFSYAPQLSGYFLSTLIITITIVIMVVYVMMPIVTRIFSFWLNG